MSDTVVEKKEEDWMQKKWRPMMAFMYMFCCLCDFALFPIMFTIVQFWEVSVANDAFRQWVPITLQGGGLFHVAMGAVLGVSAYGRTQEKVAGAAVNPPTPINVTPPVVTQTPTPPPVVVAAAVSAPVTYSSTGKPAPAPAAEPPL